MLWCGLKSWFLLSDPAVLKLSCSPRSLYSILVAVYGHMDLMATAAEYTVCSRRLACSAECLVVYTVMLLPSTAIIAAQQVAITPDIGRLQPAIGPIVNHDVMMDKAEPPSALRVTSRLSWSALWKDVNSIMIGACDGLMGNATALAQLKVHL